MRTLLISLLLAAGFESHAQLVLKTEYMTASPFDNKAGENFGSGNFLKISGRYSLPLSIRLNGSGQVTLWAASVNGSYGMLDNNGAAHDYNPDKILNASLNLTHIRPISSRWSLMATLGSGVYAAPDEITGKSILVNGGLIFMYKIRNNLDLGVGAGLTNSYGLPVVMPMTIINWRLSGKYEVKVDIASGMEISGAVKFNEKFKVRLVGMEMDGMSSVMNIDGEYMIYSSTSMKTYLCPEYRIGKSSALYLGAGGIWLRSTTLTMRSIKDFFSNFLHDKNGHLGFRSAGYFTVGFKY